MKAIEVSLLFLIGFAAVSADHEALIVGGVNALPNEFPFLVSLQWFWVGSSAHFCGGVILSNVWILTAAHCITELPRTGSVEILAGRHNLAVNREDGQAFHSTIRNFIHPQWNIFNPIGPNDIALIRLSNQIPFSPIIRPIRLPSASSEPMGVGTFTGWGNIGIHANILQKAILMTISNSQCSPAVDALDLNVSLNVTANFCTGPLSGMYSLCNGDFGGPWFQGSAPNEVIMGIGSWRITPCGRAGAPSGVFTKVSTYVDWIRTTTGITN